MKILLEQVGFNEFELDFYKNEINRLKKILSLTDLDIDKAARQLNINFDLSFKSIQILLKELFLCIFCDFKILTEKEKKVIQIAVPMPNAIPGIVNELGKGLHISSSEYLLIYLSGVIFDVYHQINGNSPNQCKRCGLNLSRETLYNNLWYLKPNGLMICFGYCDEIHKTGELLEIEYGVKHYNLTQIHGIEYSLQKDYLEEVLIYFLMMLSSSSEDKVRITLKKMNKGNLEINMLLNKIQNLIGKTKEGYVTFNEVSLMNIFNLIYLNNHHKIGKSILTLFIKELKNRIKSRNYIMENPLRIGCMHLPFTNATMDRIFRDHNAAVVISSMYATDPDPLKSESEFDRCLSPFFKYKILTSLKEKQQFIDCIIKKTSLDGFIFGQFENDRALGGNQTLIMEGLKYKDKAYYMSIHNWKKISGNDDIKLESLIEVIKERRKEYNANTKKN